MADQRTILVTGATGKQGGAVARELLKRDFHVRALTRDPNKPAGQELSGLGAEVVRGDLDDRASLEQAVDGAYGVYSVQNFWETGYDREVEQGKRLADVASEAGIEHFVYSSVGSADQNTGLSHFDSKYEIEEYIQDLELPFTILRPVFFMDNWEVEGMKGMVLQGTIYQPLKPETRLQHVAVDDIGVFAGLAFSNPDEWIDRAIDLAGDAPTMTELAQIFSRVIGREVTYVQVPWDQFREQMGDEYAEMYRWFEDVGYHADIEALRGEHPGLRDLGKYLEEHGWRSAAVSESAGAR